MSDTQLAMSMFASRKDYDEAVRKQQRREKLVDALHADYMNTVRECGKTAGETFLYGCKGLSNMTLEELEEAASDADLEV